MPPTAATDRRALGSVSAQFFVNGAVAGSLFARYPEMSGRAGLSLGQWGALLTAVGGIGLVGSAAASPFIVRWTTRRVLLIGAASQVALIAVVGVAQRWWLLLIVLGAISAVDVVTDVAMNLQGSWLSARRRVGVMNRLHGLWSIGTLAGGLVAAQLAARSVGLTPHLVGVSIVLLAVLVYVRRGLLTEDERPAREPTAQPTRRRTMPITLGLFGLAAAGAVAVEQVPNDWSALRLATDLGATPGRAGMGFVAFTIGMTIGRFGGDFAAALIGRQRLFFTSLAVAAAGIATAGLIDVYWTVLIGFGVTGLGVAPFFPTVYDDAAQFPGRTGAALGALTAGSRGAGLALPSLVGALAATSLSVGGSISAVFAGALVALATAQTALRRMIDRA